MKFQKIILVLSMALIALAPASLLADDDNGPKTHFGARIGFSQDPGQVVGGLQAMMGNLFGAGQFAPSVDLGIGDDLTVVTVNGDLYFPLFSPPESSLKFFAAFGPTLAYIDGDFGSDTEIGISGSIGITSPMGGSHLYNLELKLGFGDVPELKVLFGFML